MIEDKIYIRFTDKNLKLRVVEESVNGINYVEQLVHRILTKEGVGPVYKSLFALRLVEDLIWLAPSANLKAIQTWSRMSNRSMDEPRLELRMRFQPASFVRLAYQDKLALDIIFAQVRADFRLTRFNEEKRSFVLLSEAVLTMIVLDLIRHSIEHMIPIDDILDRINPGDFLPQRASAWQRALLFHIDKQLNLRKALRLGYDQCDKDIRTLKRKYIELFVTSVADKYGAESYTVYQLQQQQQQQQKFKVDVVESGAKMVIRSERLRLRVRFSTKKSITCCNVESINSRESSDRFDSFLASSSSNNKKRSEATENWSKICDITTITHATLRRNMVQIARNDGHPIRYQFRSRWHAESFLSILDGYYRLMRRWNLNIFRDIWSPSLLTLKQIGSHGPIGFEWARRKLVEFERPGDFIVRQCSCMNNRYLIDTTLFSAKVILTINIDWCPETRRFTQAGFNVNRNDFEVSLETAQTKYGRLKQMIRDIEISVTYKSQGPFRKQLKHWIEPQDDDQHPALLLSISDEKLQQLEREDKFDLNNSLEKLPRVIPDKFLKIKSKQFANSHNGLIVDLAVTADNQTVVVKNATADERLAPDDKLAQAREQSAFHLCPEGHFGRADDPITNRHLNQMRISDWVLVKSPLFAETIGYVMSGALIQEYVPFGRLDEFLAKNQQMDRTFGLSVSFQLIQAVLYLQQRKIIHGKIRCHNVLIKQLQPMKIKLSDPLGTLDVEQDQAFIPPEYFRSIVSTCVKKYYSGIDIWALGTTMWQIFTNGSRPPSGRFANTLIQPIHCTDDIWRVIEACWVVEPSARATPQVVFRDLCDLFAWEQGSHEYFYISPEDSESDHQDPGLISSPDAHKSRTNCVQRTTNLRTTDQATSNGASQPMNGTKDSYQMQSMTRSPQFRQRSASNGHDTASLSSSGSGTTTTSRSDARMISTPAAYTKKASWRNLIGLRKNQSTSQQDGRPPSDGISDLFGSITSLDSCVTPSGSETTRMTIIDLDNIFEAFENCSWNIDKSKLKLGPEIGRGSCGVVMKGIMTQADVEQVVAVKCIDVKSSSFDMNHIDDLRREFEILKDLDHENIVKALGYVEDSQMMLIFEYIPLGSLLSCVKNLNQVELYNLPLEKYALDIVKGMEYLESKRIVHRDLALRNILLGGKNQVKIGDFGLAKSLGDEDFYELKTERALPLKWYAPETLSRHVFTHKSDVWSYGVVLWEIYSGGDSPQYSGTYYDLSKTLKHERLPKPSKCPQHMYELMCRCWAYVADDRMTFTQIRQQLEGTDTHIINNNS